MDYIHSWSGGKDSTASIILDFIHNSPPDCTKGHLCRSDV